MSDITLILLAAGSSSRFGLLAKKQWLRIGHDPLWLMVAQKLSTMVNAQKVVIVGDESELELMRIYAPQFEYVAGGKQRQDSLFNALQMTQTSFVMSADVARACVDENVVRRLLEQKENYSCVVPFISVVDTVLQDETLLPREKLKAIQTPQLSRTQSLKKALSQGTLFTDDSTAVASMGESVGYVEGSFGQLKLTNASDLKLLSCLESPSTDCFCGQGYDAHRFEQGKKMVLGGVEMECSYGFLAHSDGDVLVHAIIDAVLGAAGAFDIGWHFPDTKEQYKGIDSLKLLEYAVKFVQNIGFEIVNIDATVIAQQPRLDKLKTQMRQKIAATLCINAARVNIKATTTEKMGFTGRAEGAAAQAVATLKYYNWKNV